VPENPGRAISFTTQYDAEVFLRIEHALGKKMEQLTGLVKDEVMILAERVNEAQTVAKQELRDANERNNARRGTHKHNGKRKGRGDRMDADEG